MKNSKGSLREVGVGAPSDISGQFCRSKIVYIVISKKFVYLFIKQISSS